MEEKLTTFGLNPKKLAHLLSMGCKEEGSQAQIDFDHQMAELFTKCVSETLPSTQPFMPVLEDVCGSSDGRTKSPTDITIGELLKNPQTELTLLTRIKNYGKKMTLSAKSDPGHEVGVAIYYAAIANALVFHQTKITRFTCGNIEKAFSLLTGKKWMPHDFAELFVKACYNCKKEISRR